MPLLLILSLRLIWAGVVTILRDRLQQAFWLLIDAAVVPLPSIFESWLRLLSYDLVEPIALAALLLPQARIGSSVASKVFHLAQPPPLYGELCVHHVAPFHLYMVAHPQMP